MNCKVTSHGKAFQDSPNWGKDILSFLAGTTILPYVQDSRLCEPHVSSSTWQIDVHIALLHTHHNT